MLDISIFAFWFLENGAFPAPNFVLLKVMLTGYNLGGGANSPPPMQDATAV